MRNERKETNVVQIDLKIRTLGKTFEDALAILQGDIEKAKVVAEDADGLSKKYHYWDKENECDVDWTAYHDMDVCRSAIIDVKNRIDVT